MTHLLLTVQMLDDRYHGLLARNGPPEWPPSPFRLFCALVAGVARRGELERDTGNALAWLQGLEPPFIIAPKSKEGQRFIRFVPNNDGDKKPDRQERLAAKPNIPTLMLLKQNEKPQLHYLWDITGRTDVPFNQIRDAARSLVALGWGIDMAFGDAKLVTEADIQKLSGVRWYPKRGERRDDSMLRVPILDAERQESTLHDLNECHETAMARIEHGKPLHTVRKPRVYEQVFYASSERPLGRPYVVFELRNEDGTRFRYPQERLVHIAGMVRHLAIELMSVSPPEIAGKSDEWVRSYVAGHCGDESKQHRQFSYLPLPSVGMAHTDPSVRRVMIAAPLGDDRLLEHLARLLAGQRLKPTIRTKINHAPTLVRIYRDSVISRYVQSGSIWASVTPVILPGYNDHKPEKTRKLILKALQQSGIDQPCEFTWSAVSQFPKSLSAHKYDRNKRPTGYIRPGHLLSKTAVHVNLHFDEGVKFPGPLAIGAGRHCGFGLMAGSADAD